MYMQRLLKVLQFIHKPENREYSAIGVIDDDEVGQRSDIVGVSFGG